MGAGCSRMVDDALEDRRLRACTDKNTAKFLRCGVLRLCPCTMAIRSPLQQDMQSEVRHDYSRYALRGSTPQRFVDQARQKRRLQWLHATGCDSAF